MRLLEMHLLRIQLDSVFHHAFQTGGRIDVSRKVGSLVNGNELVLWLHEIDSGRFSLMDDGAAKVNVRLQEVVLHRRLLQRVTHFNALGT